LSISERDKKIIWHPFTQAQIEPDSIAIVCGEGATLTDERGRRYIDAVSSWWVNLHGHANPHIAKAIKEQLEKLHQVIFAGFTHEPAVRLAEKLLSILPSNQSRIFYSDDGSTAVEAALKMCVQFWNNLGQKRSRFLALEGGYHGDTFGAMSVSGRGLFNAPFDELLFEVCHLPNPDSSQAITKLKSQIDSGLIAGFIYEPLLQGSAGMKLYSAQGLEQMLRICRQAGIPLIADEVLTGFGRTGKTFASDYLDTKPDIIALSKGLSGGTLAIGVTSASEAIYTSFLSNDRARMFLHGHSYTANPLACAASLASLELLQSSQTTQAISRISESHLIFASKLRDQPFPHNVRTLGSMLAFEYGEHAQSSYSSDLRDRLYRFFIEKGVLLRPLGNTIYVLPPYCIEPEQLSLVYDAILEALTLRLK